MEKTLALTTLIAHASIFTFHNDLFSCSEFGTENLLTSFRRNINLQ